MGGDRERDRGAAPEAPGVIPLDANPPSPPAQLRPAPRRRSRAPLPSPPSAARGLILPVLPVGPAVARCVPQELVEKKEVIKEIVKENKRPFYCELCDKQYRNHAARTRGRTSQPRELARPSLVLTSVGCTGFRQQADSASRLRARGFVAGDGQPSGQLRPPPQEAPHGDEGAAPPCSERCVVEQLDHTVGGELTGFEKATLSARRRTRGSRETLL